jgi:hypothetical protein
MRDGDYEWFITLAELEHVTAAAEQLRIAQPTLTRMLARLERQLGVYCLTATGGDSRSTPTAESSTSTRVEPSWSSIPPGALSTTWPIPP